MHTAQGGWEDSKEVWDAPRVRYKGVEVRGVLGGPGLCEEEEARAGELCWGGPEEDWGESR